MPPKKSGKKKKTKAELEAERLLQEEEERKAQEANLKKQAEDAEKKRLEDLRIEAERKAYRMSEMERLCAEYNTYLDEQVTRDQKLAAEEAEETAKADWENYTNPTDKPDATSQRDMNTFVSLISEHQTSTMKETLELVQKVIEVCRSVEVALSDAITQNNTAGVSRCRDYLCTFYDIIIEKVDAATIHFLRFSENSLDSKTEIHVEEVTPGGLWVGMWASYADMRLNRKAVLFENMGFSMDIPKQILQQEARFVHRIIKMPIDKYSSAVYDTPRAESADLVDRKGRYVIGDLFFIEILHSPPPVFSLKAKRWTIRDRSTISLNLRRSAYPSNVASRCTFKVADDVVMGEDIYVAKWDEETLCWSQEGITDYQYNETSRHVQFYVTVVGTFALVRERKSDFPYKKWSLVPVYSANTVPHERYDRLTVQTQRHEVVIDISGTSCKLVKPNNKSLSYLVGVPMTSGELLYKLLRIGINLLPTDADCQGLREFTPKMFKLENDILRNISRCGSSLEFSSSPWNQMLKQSEIGLLAKESTVYVGGIEHFDFECILCEDDAHSETYLHAPSVGVIPGAGVKYTLVMGNEYGDRKAFSKECRPDEVTHAELYLCMKNRLTDEAIERIARTNVRFAKALFMLMRMIRPLSLS